MLKYLTVFSRPWWIMKQNNSTLYVMNIFKCILIYIYILIFWDVLSCQNRNKYLQPVYLTCYLHERTNGPISPLFLSRTIQVISLWVTTQLCATALWLTLGTISTTRQSVTFCSLQMPTCWSTAALQPFHKPKIHGLWALQSVGK